MIPSSTPDPGPLGLYVKHAGLRCLYLLTLVPVFTDLIENGRLPLLPR